MMRYNTSVIIVDIDVNMYYISLKTYSMNQHLTLSAKFILHCAILKIDCTISLFPFSEAILKIVVPS